MNIVEVLQIKFPGIDLIREVTLRDTGDGPFIAEWFREEPFPSTDDISKWISDEEVQKQFEYEQNQLKNTEVYDKLNEIDMKSIRALRVNDTEKLQELESQAVALREQLLPSDKSIYDEPIEVSTAESEKPV